MNLKFKQIVKLLQKLPGVGPRQASRFVVALMGKPESELKEIGSAIANLKKEIKFCPICFNISDNHHCSICTDPKRDSSKILIVEKVADLESIEKTGLYKGIYHVLGGAINPLDGITGEKLKIKELHKRLGELKKDNKDIELIIATNPNTSGETTALYIRDQLTDKGGILVTRLGRGLASGSHLEYADETTLKHALEYRK